MFVGLGDDLGKFCRINAKVGLDKALGKIHDWFLILEFDDNSFSYFSQEATLQLMTELGVEFKKPRFVSTLGSSVLLANLASVVEVVEEENEKDEGQAVGLDLDHEVLEGTPSSFEIPPSEQPVEDRP
ncbi:hypothetical protein ACH5RR_007173 [Cinchona calisaya]|uniref:Uncharacterized protein n=1 Tax=Cinchona calisaya TaxID=153742 RepID=A0ABD3ARI2_9GENT